MPKLIKNNNKVRRATSHKRNGADDTEMSDKILEKQPGQEFGIVKRPLGGAWILCECLDKIDRVCHIRGRMRKKDWINQGDVVLLGLREHEDNKADIICKLNPQQVRGFKGTNENQSSKDDIVEFDFDAI
jgi:translation initiation factor 1A